MTRSKEKRSRVLGMSLFDATGMPKPRGESSLLALPASNRVQLPARTPLGQRNPNIEVQLLSQKNELMTLKKPVRDSVKYFRERGNLLGGSCDILGKLLKAEQTQLAVDPEPGSLITKAQGENGLILFHYGSTMQWVVPVKTVVELPSGDEKTTACIREKGSMNVMMSAQSGWKSSNTCEGNLLNNSCWTNAVREFCFLLGHLLPAHPWYDRQFPGQFYACHVEKKLILYFVCHFLSDGVTGLLDEKKLKEIKRRPVPLEAIITITRAPCDDCYRFRDEIQQLTGIKFHFEGCKEVGQTETYRDGNVTRRRLVSGGVKEFKLYKNIAQVQGNNSPKKLMKEARITKPNNSTRILTEKAGVSKKRNKISKPVQKEHIASFVVTKNPNMAIVLPLRTVSSIITEVQGLKISLPRAVATSVTFPETPKRSTRSNGMLTPPMSPNCSFSFDAFDKALDALNRKRVPRKFGTKRNPFVL